MHLQPKGRRVVIQPIRTHRNLSVADQSTRPRQLQADPRLVRLRARTKQLRRSIPTMRMLALRELQHHRLHRPPTLLGQPTITPPDPLPQRPKQPASLEHPRLQVFSSHDLLPSSTLMHRS
jgi:hypothetical protein